MATASSTRGQMSQMRSFHRRVASRRADVPADLAAVADGPQVPVPAHDGLVVGPGVERSRHARARQPPDDALAVGLQTGLAPRVEGRRRRQRQQERHVRPDRGHHPDAQIRRAEPRVHVHAADEEPPYFLLERDLGLPVSPPLGDPLLVPPREGMGGRGDDRGAVAARPVDDDAAGFVEARTKLGDGSADPRAGLDLGARELVDDLVRPAVGHAGIEDGRVGIGDDVAGIRIDDHQLLFDAQGQVHDGGLPGVWPVGGRRGRGCSVSWGEAAAGQIRLARCSGSGMVFVVMAPRPGTARSRVTETSCRDLRGLSLRCAGPTRCRVAGQPGVSRQPGPAPPRVPRYARTPPPTRARSRPGS